MNGVLASLPHNPRGSIAPHSPYDPDGVLSPQSIYQMQHAAHYQPAHRSSHADVNALRAQQHFLATQYAPSVLQPPITQRQSLSVLNPAQLTRMNSYGFSHFSPVDPRFGPQAFMMDAPMSPDFGKELPRPLYRP